jgi:hypothetical protein
MSATTAKRYYFGTLRLALNQAWWNFIANSTQIYNIVFIECVAHTTVRLYKVHPTCEALKMFWALKIQGKSLNGQDCSAFMSWLWYLTSLCPTIRKNREKSCFLYTQEISHRQIFLVKLKKISAHIFIAVSWQDFCNFYCKFFIGS